MNVTITLYPLREGYLSVYSNDRTVLEAIVGPLNADLIEDSFNEDPTNGLFEFDAQYRVVVPLDQLEPGVTRTVTRAQAIEYGA